MRSLRIVFCFPEFQPNMVPLSEHLFVIRTKYCVQCRITLAPPASDGSELADLRLNASLRRHGTTPLSPLDSKVKVVNEVEVEATQQSHKLLAKCR